MTGALRVTLGQDRISGATVTTDLRRGPHILIAGTTGSGKSVAIHAILCDLLAQYTPAEVGLVLVDPKRVELGDYAAVPHLVMPVKRDPLEAIEALTAVLAETETRFRVMEGVGARDISAVPLDALRAAGIRSRYLVVVVDELADLIMASKSLPAPMKERIKRGELGETEVTLARILQIGRAAGVHMILATQRPSSDIVTGVIKANVPSRLCFALQNATDSRVALGRKGAEELEGKGDALWLPVGAREAKRLQGKFVQDPERDAILERWDAVPRIGDVGTGQQSDGQQSGQQDAKRSQWAQMWSLGDLPAPELTLIPVEGQASRLMQRRAEKAVRKHAKHAEHVEAWNNTGRTGRLVATILATLIVYGGLALLGVLVAVALLGGARG